MRLLCICIVKENNVKFVSFTGKGIYSLFETADEAAKCFVKSNNTLTHEDNKERGAYIYKIKISGNICYFYTRTKPGKHNNVIKNVITGYSVGLAFKTVKSLLTSDKIKIGSVTPVAFVHTHPSCICHVGEDFSKQDKLLIKFPFVKIMYLGTPKGFLYGYDKFCTKRLVSPDMPTAVAVAHNSRVQNI